MLCVPRKDEGGGGGERGEGGEGGVVLQGLSALTTDVIWERVLLTNRLVEKVKAQASALGIRWQAAP